MWWWGKDFGGEMWSEGGENKILGSKILEKGWKDGEDGFVNPSKDVDFGFGWDACKT